MKNYILILLIFLIYTTFYGCTKEQQDTPLTEGTYVAENGVPWNAAVTNFVKNDSVTFYGKTDYDLLKLKFSLQDIADHIGVQIKNYQVDYALVSPGASVFKPDPAYQSYISAYSFEEKSTHLKWMQVDFSFVFKNITPAILFDSPNFHGAFRIKMP